MPEGEFIALGELHLVDELVGNQTIEGRLDFQAVQIFVAEAHSDHCRRAQCSLGRRFETVDARGDRRLQRGRHTDFSDVASRRIGAADPFEQAALGEVADDLLGEERVACGTLRNALGHRSRHGARTQQLTDQCRGLCAVQAVAVRSPALPRLWSTHPDTPGDT